MKNQSLVGIFLLSNCKCWIRALQSGQERHIRIRRPWDWNHTLGIGLPDCNNTAIVLDNSLAVRRNNNITTAIFRHNDFSPR